MDKFTEDGNRTRPDKVTIYDTPAELAEKIYNDSNYFQNNPRGYKNMAEAARESRWHDEAARQFNKHVSIIGKTVLDVGCATGVILRAFRDLGASEVYGVELSDYASQIAKEVIGDEYIITGSGHDLSKFADNSIDVYFTSEVIEHVPYTHHLYMLREAYRVLKPNGVAYIQGQIGFKDYINPDPNDDVGHIAVLPRGYWKDLIEDVGFRTIRDWNCCSLSEEKMWKEYNWKYFICQK